MFANIDRHGLKVQITNMITFYITCLHTLITRAERCEKVHPHLKTHCLNYNSIGYRYHYLYQHRLLRLQRLKRKNQESKHFQKQQQGCKNYPSLPKNDRNKTSTTIINNHNCKNYSKTTTTLENNRNNNYSCYYFYYFSYYFSNLVRMHCRQRIALSTFLLILFLMQAVVSQGHKELWGKLFTLFKTCSDFCISISVRDLNLTGSKLSTIQIGADTFGYLPNDKSQPFIGYMSQFTLNSIDIFNLVNKPTKNYHSTCSAQQGEVPLNLSTKSIVLTQRQSLFWVKQPFWNSGKYKFSLEIDFNPADTTQGVLYFCDLFPQSNKYSSVNYLFLAIEVWKGIFRLTYNFHDVMFRDSRSTNQIETRPLNKDWNVLLVQLVAHNESHFFLVITLNGDPSSKLVQVKTDLFQKNPNLPSINEHIFGGTPYWDFSDIQKSVFSTSGFLGCLNNIRINGAHIQRHDIKNHLGELTSSCEVFQSSYAMGIESITQCLS